MKDRCKGRCSLVEHKPHYTTHNKFADWKHPFCFKFFNQRQCVVLWICSVHTIVHKMPAVTWTLLNSVPEAAGIFLYPTTPFMTYSIWPSAYMLIGLTKANLCNLNQWNNYWLGLKETQYGSVTFLCRPRGLFVLHGAWALPPLPLMPRQGLMGTSVISNSGPVNTNSSVYYHNL